MENKICVITGANSGIGKLTAIELAKKGATVVMVCRNETKGIPAQKEIIELSANESVHLMIADLSSQKSIRQFVSDFKQQYKQLHILINNAGAVFAKRMVTEDGLEATFATNHLGYFLLTNLSAILIASSKVILILSKFKALSILLDNPDSKLNFTYSSNLYLLLIMLLI